jgi:hypothetical protein
VTVDFGGRLVDHLHPSKQVQQYQRYLIDTHPAFTDGWATSATPGSNAGTTRSRPGRLDAVACRPLDRRGARRLGRPSAGASDDLERGGRGWRGSDDVVAPAMLRWRAGLIRSRANNCVEVLMELTHGHLISTELRFQPEPLVGL